MVYIILWLLGNRCARSQFDSYRCRTDAMEASSSDMADHDRIDPNPSHLHDVVLSAGVAPPEKEYQGSKGYQLRNSIPEYSNGFCISSDILQRTRAGRDGCTTDLLISLWSL